LNYKILVVGSSEGVGLTFYFTRLAVMLSQIGNNVTIFSERNAQYPNLQIELDTAEVKRYVSNFDWNSDITSLVRVGAELRAIIHKEGSYDIIFGGGAKDGVRIFFGAERFDRKLRRIATIGYMPDSSVAAHIAVQSYNLFYDRAVALCDYSKNELEKAGIAGEKIFVTPLFAPDIEWFDTAKYTEVKLDDYSLQESIEPVIWYAASHFQHKGFQDYLSAASKVLKKCDATFVVGGKGPLTPLLKRIVEKLGISTHVLFTGWISNYHMPYLLNNVADICVSTSLLEHLPSYILECMAARKPVVASSVGGVPEIVENGVNGYLVYPHDSEATAHYIIDLINNPKEATEMGLNGRKVVEEKFNLKCSLLRFMELYEMSL
jgi:glycosyltransferase involved in cell wall biosynthesis